MRAALAMLVLLTGCSELDPSFAVSMWTDDVEQTGLISERLHALGAQPGEWARTSDRGHGDSEMSWRFGDGSTYPSLCEASLRTPEFEAGATSFLRFAYFSDLQPLSATNATDGVVVEGQIEDGEWVLLEPNEGYPTQLDQLVVGSPFGVMQGLFSGNDREWHEDYVELPDAARGDMVRFRFRFGCDIDAANNVGEGFFVDDAEFLIVE